MSNLSYRSQRDSLVARIWIICLSCILLVAVAPRAVSLDPSLQPSQYILDEWQTSAGLPENVVETIARTPDGYLWVGTQEGLARFDGVRFTVFNRSNEPAIPSNLIRVLCVDRAGRLWIGTHEGLIVLENGRFRSYHAVGLEHARIRAILEDSTRRLWVGTDHGVVEITGEHSQVFNTADGLRDGGVRSLLEDRSGAIWVATATGGLHRYNGKTFESVQMRADGMVDPVSAMHEDADGTLWLATSTGALYRKILERIDVVAQHGELGSAIHALTRDRDGNLWIATDGKGLVRLHDGVFSALQSDHSPGYDIHALYEDREAILWIGTFGNGLLRLRDGKFAPLGTPEGLQGNMAWSIAPHASGGVWIGTASGVSSYAGGVIRFMPAPPGIGAVQVRSLLEDRNGALWVGTDGAGVYRRDASGVTIFNLANGLSGNAVKAISEDREGRIWVGTNAGLDAIDHGKVTSMQHLLPGLTEVRGIYEDRAGNRWVRTASYGLLLINGQTTRRLGLSDGLPSPLVSAIYEDERGVIWLATIDGLAVWRDGKAQSLAKFAAPLAAMSLQVLEDQQHRIWLASNKGLVSIPRDNLDALASGRSVTPDIHAYDESDGLRTMEFNGGNSPSGCRTPDGRLWFPTIRGIVSVDPAHIRTNGIPPPVQIEQVTVDATSLPALPGLQVNAGQQQWEFHYTALSLLAAQQSRFKYRLEGFDEQWIDAGDRRTAYYTRLPPGTFTFRVIANNNDGVWNNSGATFSFTVKPHFYQTWWFFLICALLVLLLARVMYEWRVRKLRQLAQALSAQVADRTRDLEMANKQILQAQATLVTTARQAGMAEIANNVLHNVGNVLNSVNVSAALIGSRLRESKSAGLAKAVNLMNEHASDIGTFITLDERGKALPGYLNKLVTVLGQEKQGIADELDSLTKSIDHIKEIVATQQSYSGVSSVIEPVQVKDLLEDALRMNAGSIAHHQISIVKEFADVPLVPLDKHLMLQILINLIGNAKHALNRGTQQPHQIKLKLDIAETSDTPRLRIRIEDNGEGIAPENLTRLFAHGFTTRKNGHGFGLHSCALAMKEMKGSITAFSDGLGRGAAFVVELPMNREPA